MTDDIQILKAALAKGVVRILFVRPDEDAPELQLVSQSIPVDLLARLIERVENAELKHTEDFFETEEHIKTLREQVKEYEAALKKIHEYRSDAPDWNMVMAIAEDAIAPKQIVLSGQREGGLE